MINNVPLVDNNGGYDEKQLNASLYAIKRNITELQDIIEAQILGLSTDTNTGFSSLGNDINSTQDSIKKLEARHKEDVTQIYKDLNTHVKENNDSFKSIEKSLKTLKASIDAANANILALQTNKANQYDLTLLEQRVAALESKPII